MHIEEGFYIDAGLGPDARFAVYETANNNFDVRDRRTGQLYGKFLAEPYADAPEANKTAIAGIVRARRAAIALCYALQMVNPRGEW